MIYVDSKLKIYISSFNVYVYSFRTIQTNPKLERSSLQICVFLYTEQLLCATNVMNSLLLLLSENRHFFHNQRCYCFTCSHVLTIFSYLTSIPVTSLPGYDDNVCLILFPLSYDTWDTQTSARRDQPISYYLGTFNHS